MFKPLTSTPGNSIFRRVIWGLSFALLTGSLFLAHAQTSTWDGGGGDALWSTAENWTGNISIASGDTIQFGGGTNLDTVNDQAANFSLGALDFLNTLTGNVTISGNNVFNLDGTIDVASVGGSTLTHTIDNDLLISALRTIEVNGDETLVISGDMTSDDGTDDLRKTGTGTLLLTGTNNDSTSGIDIIQLRVGTVQFKVDSNLGKGRVHIGQSGNSGTLEFVGDTGAAITVDSQIRSTSNAGVVQTILANGVTVNDTVILSSFGTNGNGDTLVLGGDNAGNNQITDDIEDVAGASLTKVGLGTWSLVANQTYAGDTTVSSGRLNILGSATSTISVGDGATFGGGGSTTGNLTLGAGGSNYVYEDSLGAFGAADLTVTTGAGNHTVFIEGAAPVGVTDILTFTGTLSSSADINDDFQLDAGVTVSDRGATFGTTANSVTLDLGFKSLVWDNGESNATWDNASVLGSGNASQNWTGTDEFFNGDSATFGDVGIGNVTLANATTANTVEFSNTSGTYQLDGASTLTMTGGVVHSGTGNVTINASLSGTGGLTKSGAGELILAGDNNYSGAVDLNAGTTTLTSLTGLGSGTVTLSNTGTTLQVTGAGGTLANGFVFSTAGNAKTFRTNLTGADTLTLTGALALNEPSNFRNVFDTGADDTLEISGLITGDGGVQKSGTGVLRLSNDANAYGAGAGNQIRITRGTIEFTSIGDIGEASAAGVGNQIRIGNGNREGTLSYVGGGNESTNRTVQIGSESGDGGSIIQTNSGAGTLSFTATQFNSAVNGTGILARTLLLTGDNAGDNVIAGNIIDNTGAAVPANNSVSLRKEGIGKWVLGGTNVYTGTTSVSGGTLLINGDQSGATGSVMVSSGTLGGTGIIGGAVEISGTHTAGTTTGVGTQTFNSNLTYNSGSTVVWNLIDESSTAGTGWDLFDINNGGVLDFNATTNFVITAGSGIDFNETFWNSSHEFLVWDYTDGSLFDFNATDFNISVTGGTGVPSGSFALGQNGGNTGIVLSYTAAIPEPGTYAVMGVGLAGFGWVMRRRKVRKSSA